MVTQAEHEKLLRDCASLAFKYHIKNIDDVKDILQDCYYSSLNKTVINIPAYIYVSFRNNCIDEYRRRKSAVYMKEVSLSELKTIPLDDNKIDIDSSDLDALDIAQLILDSLNKDYFLHIPTLHKDMYRSYYMELGKKESYKDIASKNNMRLSTTIEIITNLTNYCCLLTMGKFYSKFRKVINKKTFYQIFMHTLRKQEYLKYSECITSAHYGYHFNFDLFKEACKEMLSIELVPMDKHNKEKLKQAALKLFTELYRVDEVTQSTVTKSEVEPVNIEQNETKDTATTEVKTKGTARKSNKKPL